MTSWFWRLYAKLLKQSAAEPKTPAEIKAEAHVDQTLGKWVQ